MAAAARTRHPVPPAPAIPTVMTPQVELHSCLHTSIIILVEISLVSNDHRQPRLCLSPPPHRRLALAWLDCCSHPWHSCVPGLGWAGLGWAAICQRKHWRQISRVTSGDQRGLQEPHQTNFTLLLLWCQLTLLIYTPGNEGSRTLYNDGEGWKQLLPLSHLRHY